MRAPRRVTSTELLRPWLAAMLLGAAASLFAPALGEEPPPESRGEPTVYMGRTIAPPMHYSGADWLLRTSREQEEAPEKLWNALRLKAGQTVCDFGCGNGYHTLPLARRVRATGVVYAVDIQPEMLDMLQERADARGLKNIRTILATPDDPNLPAGAIDLVLMVDVYHEIADPPAVLKAVLNSLKPNGRLVLAEFREEDPAVPILPLHKTSKRQVHRELTANGFKLVRDDDQLPWQHLLFYAPKSARGEALMPSPWSPTE